MSCKQRTATSSPRRIDHQTVRGGQDSSTTTTQKRTLMQALCSLHTSSNPQVQNLTVASTEKQCRSTHFIYREKDELGRARVFDAQSGTELKRHSDLWFYDGSIVCRAEDTLFRVHMSLLARQSTCFRDMLALPQPVEELDETTGFDVSQEKDWGAGSKAQGRIPIIILHDTAEDVENLFRALIDGPSFGNNDREDFRVVSGILRLATKYLFESLRAVALAHLSTAWPSTLKNWEAREDGAQSYELDHPHKPRLFPHPFLIINLAREIDAPELLPAAFYDISRYSYAQIFESSEDGPFGIYPSPCPMISPLDMQRFTLGKEAIQHMVTNLIQTMGNSLPNRQVSLHSSYGGHRRSGSGVCVSAMGCKKDFSELMDLATQHYLFDRERGSCDPLYVAEELGQLKGTEFSECKACALSLECWAAREREKIWRMIPGWFRLDAASNTMSKK